MSGEAESSETTSVVFRDRPSVKSLATRFERNGSRRKSSVFSSTSARKKWRNFEKKVNSVHMQLPSPPTLTLLQSLICGPHFSLLSQITDAIMNRLTVAMLSRDMDRWIEKRDQLSRRADELRYHQSHLLKESSPVS